MNNRSCNSQGRETTLPACWLAIFSTDTVNAFLYGNRSPQRSLFERLESGLPAEAAQQFDGPGCAAGAAPGCRMLSAGAGLLQTEMRGAACEPLSWDKSDGTAVAYPRSHSSFGAI